MNIEIYISMTAEEYARFMALARELNGGEVPEDPIQTVLEAAEECTPAAGSSKTMPRRRIPLRRAKGRVATERPRQGAPAYTAMLRGGCGC